MSGSFIVIDIVIFFRAFLIKLFNFISIPPLLHISTLAFTPGWSGEPMRGKDQMAQIKYNTNLIKKQLLF